MSEIPTSSSTHRFQIAGTGEGFAIGSTRPLWCEYTVDDSGHLTLRLSHGDRMTRLGDEVFITLDQLDQLRAKLRCLPRDVA